MGLGFPEPTFKFFNRNVFPVYLAPAESRHELLVFVGTISGLDMDVTILALVMPDIMRLIVTIPVFFAIFHPDEGGGRVFFSWGVTKGGKGVIGVQLGNFIPLVDMASRVRESPACVRPVHAGHIDHLATSLERVAEVIDNPHSGCFTVIFTTKFPPDRSTKISASELGFFSRDSRTH